MLRKEISDLQRILVEINDVEWGLGPPHSIPNCCCSDTLQVFAAYRKPYFNIYNHHAYKIT